MTSDAIPSVPVPSSADVPTPQQRDEALTIFEKSVSGRRAAQLPDAGVPEPPLAELMLRRTHYARRALGLEQINPGPVVREFAVRVPDLDALFERARAEGINPGYRLGRDYPEYADGLLVAITERRSREDIDRLERVASAARAEVGV